VMLDIFDNPGWLHRILAFMRDGILKTHREAEQAGDWKLLNHENQTMPYAGELDDPVSAPDKTVSRKDLWCFCASQEFTLVGPKQFNEFMFQYQMDIIKHFGLVAYGCCEDLGNKIDVLRQLPNLRRIAVSPMADVKKCAEEIKQDYIFSYRPSPSDMVGCGFNPEKIRTLLKEDLEACKDCFVDITLKDVQTVEGDTDREST
jgi:hypothetical protein